MAANPYEPLIPPDAIPDTPRISARKFFFAVGGFGVICLAGVYAYVFATFFQEDDRKTVLNATISEGQALTPIPKDNPLMLPKSYAEVLPAPLQAPAAQTVRPQESVGANGPIPTVTNAGTVPGGEYNPFREGMRARGNGRPPSANGGQGQKNTQVARPQPPHPLPPPGGGQLPEKPKPSNWLFATATEGQSIGKPPFPRSPEEQASRRQSTMFPSAAHEIPENPLRVVYPSQIINGLLQNDINSDQPGPVRILVAEDITDRWNQGVVLIPQSSTILGAQAIARVAYGQSRVELQLTHIELPDGGMMALKGAKAGDVTGASGLAGKVDNHYVRLGVGAVLQAVLSVGSRSVAGNPTGYNPTITQDAAADISKSINQSGQRIIQRELDASPTIRVPRLTPVTLQLSEPLNLQAPPIVAK